MSLWTMTDNVNGKPKHLSENHIVNNVSDKNATIGVSAAEAADPASKAIGLTTPGWVKYMTYTDAQGNVRHKSEVLVAAGSMGSDGNNGVVDDLYGITSGVQAPSSPGGSPSSPPSSPSSPPAQSGTTYTGWTTTYGQGVTFNGSTQLQLAGYPGSAAVTSLYNSISGLTAGTPISFVLGGTTYSTTIASPVSGGGGPSVTYISLVAFGGAPAAGEVSSVTIG
jgi:hypothetical protein